jgi:hypothetical protein
MARTMSNSFSVAMKTVTATTMIAERIDGTVTFQKISDGLAPSMRAASTISVGTPLSAADRTTVAKPTSIHTRTTMSRRLFHGDSLSQLTGEPPSQTTIWLSRPICSPPAPLYW